MNETLYFGFWYYGQFSCVIFFSISILQNVNKDYLIFLYFRNFVAKSNQKPEKKNGTNETLDYGT